MSARLTAVLVVLAAVMPAAAGAQTLAVDSGFRPATDGFSFPNYGEGEPNLSAAEMRRLFGDVVCGSKPAADDCALTPPAKAWMDETNAAMDGGHCMGFSVAALRFFAGASSPTPFGGGNAFALTFQPPIAREIAYGWAYQVLDSVQEGKVDGTPKQILERLRTTLPSKAETYTIAIFKPEFVDGHAITPYAIEDRGAGKFALKVYDNNFPNEDREVIIDTVADTFEYNTAVNPEAEVDLYKGNAKTGTFFLYPTTPGQGEQPCPFCEGPPASQKVEVSSTGSIRAHARVSVSDGRRTVGFPKGPLVNTFGSRADAVRLIEQRGEDIQREPYYRVPARRAYTIKVENRTSRPLKGEGVRITGPAFDASVRGLRLARKQVVTIRVAADGRRVSFTSNRPLDSSTIAIGRTEAGPDHGFVFRRDNTLRRGKRLVFSLDPNADKLKIEGASGRYDLLARRVDDAGDQVLLRKDIDTGALNDAGGDEVTFDFKRWDGSSGSSIGVEGESGEEQRVKSEVPPGSDPEQAEEKVAREEIPGSKEEK